MVDTVVSITNLLTEFFQDGQAAGSITPQYMRNLILSLGTAQGVRVVTVAGAIGQVSSDRLIIVNQTVPASTTITLLASPAIGQAIAIKDGSGTAGTYNLIIVPSTGTIEGHAKVVIAVNYGSVELVYNGTGWSISHGPTQPAGRNPYNQPFASTDFWNIGIGSGATWESPSAPATAKLITLPGNINTNGNYNQPIYLGHNSDPLVTITCTDTTLSPIATQTVRIPIGAIPSGGTDGTAGTFTGSIATTVLTVTALSSAFLAVSQLITGTGITGVLMITAQLTGSAGSTGTYSLSRAPGTLGSRTFTATYNGDLIMNLFDKTQPNKMWSYGVCVLNVSDSNGAVTASTTSMTTNIGGIFDITNSGVYTFGNDSFPNFSGGGTEGYYGGAAGTIRDWEMTAGVIRHALRYSLSPDAETWTVGPQTPVGYYSSNVPWPQAVTDYCGGPTAVTFCGSQEYQTPGSGNLIPYGSTLGIPASTVLTGLGLSAPGLMLANCIQQYGMVQRDSGGSNQIALYTETISSGNTAAVTAMASDFNAIIVPLLRRMTNQSTNGVAPNGGGTYPPSLPPVDMTMIP